MINKIVVRGEVWLADLGETKGSIQGGTRPVTIVQNDIGNRFSPTVQVTPLSSNVGKCKLPTHMIIDDENAVPKPSLVLAEQTRVIDKTQLIRKIGFVNESTMQNIEQLIHVEFGLTKSKYNNDKPFDNNKVYEMFKQVFIANKLIKKLGEDNELLRNMETIKNFQIKNLTEYCSYYNKDIRHLKQQYMAQVH